MVRKKIAIIGGGVTGLVTAKLIAETYPELKIIVIDELDISTLINKVSRVSYVHAPSLASPLGLESESAQIWNGPFTKQNVKEGKGKTNANLYISNNLSDESETWLGNFSNWDELHKDFKIRTEKLYKFNKLANEYFVRKFIRNSNMYEMNISGNIRLYKDNQELRLVREHVKIINKLGSEAKIISLKLLLKIMPSLREYCEQNNITHGVYYPLDGKINGLEFVRFLLNDLYKRNNIAFIFARRVEDIEITKEVEIKLSDSSRIAVSKAYITAGIGVKKILRETQIPIHKIWGWSCEIPKFNSKIINRITIGFNQECMISAEFRDYVKVGGTTEIINEEEEKPDFNRMENLMLKNIIRIYGNKLDYARMKCYSGARTMTLDDLPIIENLYDNKVVVSIPTGHLGFLQAPLLAQINLENLANVTTSIDTSDYQLLRFENEKR